MIGGKINFYSTVDARSVLQYGMFNAVLLALVVGFFAVTNTSNRSTCFLAGIVVYAFYMLYQHRRIFILHKAPAKISLVGGYVGSDADFWGLVKESGLTTEQLERSFWLHFWFPVLVFFILSGLLVLLSVLQ